LKEKKRGQHDVICDIARDRSHLVAHHSCRLRYVTVYGVEKAEKEEEEGKGRRKGNMIEKGSEGAGLDMNDVDKVQIRY
jgi:hypothetical protein